MFDGKTTFPQSATIVTGLKYKDKYKGHKPEKSWPEKVHSVFNDLDWICIFLSILRVLSKLIKKYFKESMNLYCIYN